MVPFFLAMPRGLLPPLAGQAPPGGCRLGRGRPAPPPPNRAYNQAWRETRAFSEHPGYRLADSSSSHHSHFYELVDIISLAGLALL